ncbi:threonine synthase [Anaerofilum sp. BX8]|uniref:Threonine synthase n=1 Tax=Anaerofilum hominis TaxID=2763016 RepID=A0A923ID26_9FIRM|nr:threonine synthase [Anaerofilum hominis]MBC5579977.1 threonine synthase [Anaerofilum hominis]
MNYHSTRDTSLRRTASQAILQGISEEGGLFVPQEIPRVDLASLQGLDYCALAAKLLGLYLTDYSEEFLLRAARQAYGPQRFEGAAAKTVKLEPGLYSLELWHGPTSAFKDYALQLMPLLLVEAKRINRDNSKTAILVATSGDTGKAALEGYKDLPGIEIAVFYPAHGTSETQRLQMATQEGENVHVFAVEGNFDDAQTGVKRVFTDAAFAAECAAQGKHLTSANSINWGRLAPQIVYYFASYLELVRQGELQLGDALDFCVPTGNFGDILAGYYARRMGLPVRRLLCASNKNNVLTDFGASGVYDADRPFYKTASPSMDILVSSNLERLLYHESGDADLIAQLMDALAENKKYQVPRSLGQRIAESFAFGCTGEERCFAEIAATWEKDHYLADPHTAVALSVARAEADGKTPCVVLSTANPYKFSGAVLGALGGRAQQDDFADLAALEQLTGTVAPAPLRALREKPVRFEATIRPEGIPAAARAL